MTAAVVWLPNDTATRLHAVHEDVIVPRGPFSVPTICKPNCLTRLLPAGRVLGTQPPKCKTCLRKTQDPPSPGVPQPQDIPRATRAKPPGDADE